MESNVFTQEPAPRVGTSVPASHRRTVPVAAIITTYNGRTRGFVEKAIQSVLDQTVLPDEFIIIDDGSQDGTADWIRSRHPQLRVVFKANGGPASARNQGAKETTSPYLCFLDDDDMWLPHKLERQFEVMCRPGAPDLFFSAATFINERDEETGGWIPANVAYEWPQVLLLNPVISPCCAMIRRDAFVEAGGFNEAPDHKFVEDYDLWIRIARRHRMDSSPEPLTRYRQHGSQNSGNYVTMVAKVLPIVRAYAEELSGFDPRRVVVHQIYGHALYAWAVLGRPAAAEILRMNTTGKWFPEVLLLRMTGVALRRFRSAQRAWRAYEFRRLFA